jgi:molecular chaperone IbpA
MTLTTLNKLLNHPYMIGFDRFDDVFNSLDESPKFPHHNILKTDENEYSVELAVAGFSEDDIEIELANNVLSIRGKMEKTDDKNYLHRGIATRSFHKTITVTDTVEVVGAELNNGILSVNLKNIIPQEKLPKKIPIKSVSGKQLLTE